MRDTKEKEALTFQLLKEQGVDAWRMIGKSMWTGKNPPEKRSIIESAIETPYGKIKNNGLSDNLALTKWKDEPKDGGDSVLISRKIKNKLSYINGSLAFKFGEEDVSLERAFNV